MLISPALDIIRSHSEAHCTDGITTSDVVSDTSSFLIYDESEKTSYSPSFAMHWVDLNSWWTFSLIHKTCYFSRFPGNLPQFRCALNRQKGFPVLICMSTTCLSGWTIMEICRRSRRGRVRRPIPWPDNLTRSLEHQLKRKNFCNFGYYCPLVDYQAGFQHTGKTISLPHDVIRVKLRPDYPSVTLHLDERSNVSSLTFTIVLETVKLIRDPRMISTRTYAHQGAENTKAVKWLFWFFSI